ncbi:MAG: hypothetical protein E7D48_04050 [Bifidobacterium scardovii]|jgi:hypothetical protein|uniref:hypothetical protein n=1 Tax=Bifidobacterium scardovii TaxID=158787 RepID=UPI0029004944|nr:hypothetical protein [Bifidobacterium scardovii]MDU2421274.1 hypothetical protein [Bifidobacterium scardovii]
MTWFMVDDGVYDSPQTEDIPLAAMGLWVKVGSYVGRQMRDKDYDGTFDMRRLRKLGGTPKLAAQCVAAGLFEQVDADSYAIVQAANLCRFAGGADLSGKRSEAGRKGGKASGRARRSKAEASAATETEANDEANASNKNEANASRLVEPKGTIPNHTDPLTSPNPSEPEPKQGRFVSLADVEAEMLADPFAAAWNAYPRHTGSRREAEQAFADALAGHDGIPAITPANLIGAVLAYARNCDSPQHAPNMSRWLSNGAYRDYLPKPAKPRYTWGPCDEQWLQTHILSQVPEGSFEGSIASSFWAIVKAGTDPIQAAAHVVAELNRKGTPA